MGQKVNPRGLRLAITDTWNSHWYFRKNYGDFLVEDIKMRNFIMHRIFRQKGYEKVEISDIKIKRYPGSIEIHVHTSRPGLLIGKKGADIERLREDLNDLIHRKSKIHININEIKKIDLDAGVVSQMVGKLVEQRSSYKKAMKQAIMRSMRAGAKGIKIQIAGRLGGADMARRESYKEGSIPLHTFDALISYAKYDALTTYGIVGISVWIYTGKRNRKDEVLGNDVGSLVTKKAEEDG